MHFNEKAREISDDDGWTAKCEKFRLCFCMETIHCSKLGAGISSVTTVYNFFPASFRAHLSYYSYYTEITFSPGLFSRIRYRYISCPCIRFTRLTPVMAHSICFYLVLFSNVFTAVRRPATHTHTAFPTLIPYKRLIFLLSLCTVYTIHPTTETQIPFHLDCLLFPVCICMYAITLSMYWVSRRGREICAQVNGEAWLFTATKWR